MTEPAHSTPTTVDGGTLWLLRVLDVADGVDLERARALGQERGARRGAVRLRGPERGTGGVMLANAPLDLDLESAEIDGRKFRVRARLFDFGVVSVRFGLKLEPGTPCSELLKLASRLEDPARAELVDAASRAVWQNLARELRDTLRAPHDVDLLEDYSVYEIYRVSGCATAEEALRALEPARLLLAEPERPLARNIIEGYFGRAIHYYADDAAVIGWNSALVLDPDGAPDALEVLEIATARLLELRYYDRLLARELSAVYQSAQLAQRAATFFRSPFATVARRAATLFVEMTELYDRLEGALTLVGDAYSTRLYREAAQRFRLEEISAGVRDKLNTLARVSEVFEGELGHRRALVLEMTVAGLIVLEVLLGVLHRV